MDVQHPNQILFLVITVFEALVFLSHGFVECYDLELGLLAGLEVSE